MSTSEACIARAEEAERLAAMVSYGRDRERLTREAHEWREKAAELAASGPPKSDRQTDCAPAEASLLARLRQGLRRRTTGE